MMDKFMNATVNGLLVHRLAAIIVPALLLVLGVLASSVIRFYVAGVVLAGLGIAIALILQSLWDALRQSVKAAKYRKQCAARDARIAAERAQMAAAEAEAHDLNDAITEQQRQARIAAAEAEPATDWAEFAAEWEKQKRVIDFGK